MFYLFLISNFILLIRTFFIKNNIKSLLLIKKLNINFNKKTINERYVSSKLSKLLFEDNSKLLKNQILSLILFFILCIEYIYIFYFMIINSCIVYACYLLLCVMFFNEKDSIKTEILLLTMKIFTILYFISSN